ncbi:hypothetical protein PO909_008454 [Leuciscus waleckii]
MKLHQATSFLARDLFSALVGATGLPQWNFNTLQASISRKGARYIPPMFAVSCLPSWTFFDDEPAVFSPSEVKVI